MSSRKLTYIETDLLVNDLKFSITSKALRNKYTIVTIGYAVKDLEKRKRLTRSVLK